MENQESDLPSSFVVIEQLSEIWEWGKFGSFKCGGNWWKLEQFSHSLKPDFGSGNSLSRNQWQFAGLPTTKVRWPERSVRWWWWWWFCNSQTVSYIHSRDGVMGAWSFCKSPLCKHVFCPVVDTELMQNTCMHSDSGGLLQTLGTHGWCVCSHQLGQGVIDYSLVGLGERLQCMGCRM